MESRHALEKVLTDQMLARRLRRADGPVAFLHNGYVVTLHVGATIYRGHFIAILDDGRKVLEFRAGVRGFDWNAIAAGIVDVAERVAARTLEPAVAADFAGVRVPAAADLWTMLGAGLTAHRDRQPETAHS